MTIQHNLITGADLHEPKGVATAATGKVYVSDGAGSGAWSSVDAATIADQSIVTTKLAGLTDNGSAGQFLKNSGTGSLAYIDLVSYGSGYVTFNSSSAYDFTATTSDAVLNPTLTAGDMKNFTWLTSPNTRIQYDGTEAAHTHVVVNFTTRQASGSNKDVEFALFSNGVEVPGTRAIRTLDTATFGSITLQANITLNTNDYVEVRAKASGACTVEFASFNFTANGVSS